MEVGVKSGKVGLKTSAKLYNGTVTREYLCVIDDTICYGAASNSNTAVVNHVGYGTSIRGSFKASFVYVARQDWPPSPAENVRGNKITRGPVSLQWTAGAMPGAEAVAFEVHRSLGIKGVSSYVENDRLIETINGTEFIDRSQELRKSDCATYYIIAINKNGKRSHRSNTVVFSFPLENLPPM